MRCMERNKKTIYYSRLVSTTYNTDSNGFKDGTVTTNYSDPVTLRINVAPASGYTDLVNYGLNSSYLRTLITDDMNCPINEETRIWIDITPSSTNSHNYIVTEVAKSLNCIKYTIKRVDTNA